MAPRRRTGEYPCTICLRIFNRVENLKRHQKSHQSSPAHRCGICHREFSRSDLLKKHQRLHQRQQGEKSSAVCDQTRPSAKSEYRFIQETPGHPSGSSEIHRPEGVIKVQGASTQSTLSVQLDRKDPSVASDVVDLDADIDFTNFIRSWEIGECINSSEWFTQEFYDAAREASNTCNSAAYFRTHDTPAYNHGCELWSWLNPLGMSETIQSYAVVDKPTASHLPTAMSIPTANPEDPDIASRPCSPPNVPSKEDAVAFAWNPSSEKISQTQPIFISHDHDLLRHHNPRFDINESVWTGIQDFLESKETVSDDFILPSLAIANVFLGLFFERFYEQSPVLHIPTLETKQLSSALLSIMIAIGATYSHLRQTRRFSILLLFRSHQNLQDLVSRDRRLTRDPQIIYSYALMCYTGLWCGNKGAFEIAEASRGALVTYIRRLPEHHIKASDAAMNDTRKRWRGWALSESRRRLRWYVFMLDSQFPAILNMRSMMSTSEVHNWQVPCEETFWQAPGASEWRKLLGTESHPPTIKFITLFAKAKSLQAMNLPPSSLKANPWTVFLVISLLASRALDCSQDWATPTARMLVDEYDDADSSNNKESADWFDNVLMFSISNLRQEIRALLEYWGRAVVPVDDECQGDRWGVNQYFSWASGVLVGLVHLHLDISISDLQDALGKSGPHAVEEALSRFRLHLRHPLMTSDYLKPRGESSDRLPQSFTGNNLKVNSVFGRAIADIIAITDNLLLQTATPYSILGVFLNCVVLWALVKTSTKEERVLLKTYLDSTEIPLSAAGKPELKDTLSFALESTDISLENADAILMHAAQNIARLGTWGASLNLALLLQLKAFC